MTFDHKSGSFLKVKGAEIYFEDHGDKNAPVLLFLHGALGNMEDFNGIISEIPRENFRLVGIDNRGHGKSTLGSQELTLALLQEEVQSVLEHLNIDRLTIIGFSNGGTIAYRLATFSNVKIDGLITIGAPWSSDHLGSQRELFSTLTSDIWKRECPADYTKYQNLSPHGDFDALFKQVIQMALDTSPQSRPNRLMEKVNCPMLILRGEFDPVVSQACVDELVQLISHAQALTIKNAGHEIFLDQFSELVKPIKNFLNI